MNNIISHIEYLLRTSDCVTVPGLGAFIVQYVPASYDVSSHSFTPPFRLTTFNSELSHNDGVLACSIARRNNIGYDDAFKIISNEVESMMAEVRQEGEYRFGITGTFSYDNDCLVFTPILHKPLLPSINIVTLADKEKPGLSDNINVHSRFVWLKPLQAAATIIVLFLIGIMLSTPVSVEKSTVAYAKSSFPTISKPHKAVVVDSIGIELLIGTPDDADSVSDYSPVEKNRGKFGLVVASLASMSEAAKFVSFHNAYNLEVIRSGGRIRVIAFSNDNSSELYAIAKKPEFKKEYPEAWVCLK